MFKKILLSVITVVLMFAVLEAGARIYEKRRVAALPPVPQTADDFGNFKNLLSYGKELGYIQDYIVGVGSEFVPYSVTVPKPNMVFKVKNINYTHDSLGFRYSKEVVMPKPKGTYRIFMVGGSTVYGGFNDDWTIAHYLEDTIKTKIPNVEVINAGVVGYSSQEELMLLETKIVDFSPDLVIIFDGRNDLYYSILPIWKNRADQQYAEEKQNLDSLVNYPTIKSLFSYDSKFLVKESSFLTQAFRVIYRSGIPVAYPQKSEIKPQAVETYIGNLKLMKAVLEQNKINGIIAFQPTMGYCKDKLSDYELSVVDYMKNDEKSNWFEETAKVWPVVGKRISGLSSQNIVFYDFSCLFKNDKETAYIDSIHYVPKSYEKIADEFAKIITGKFR